MGERMKCNCQSAKKHRGEWPRRFAPIVTSQAPFGNYRIRRRGAEMQRSAQRIRQQCRAFLCILLCTSASLRQDCEFPNGRSGADWELPDSTQRRGDAEVRTENTTTMQGFSLHSSLYLSVSASRLRISKRTLRRRLETTGFDAEARRRRGPQREHDNNAGLFSAFISVPQRLCVKIANFQTDAQAPEAGAWRRAYSASSLRLASFNCRRSCSV